MIKKDFKKEIEKDFLEKSNPKIKQKIELLKLNKRFLKDVDILRKKWADLIDKYHFLGKEWVGRVIKLQDKYKIQKPTEFFNLITEKEKNGLWSLKQQELNVLKNDKLERDFIELAEKYKLYPTNLWKFLMEFYVIDYWFLPFVKFLGLETEPYSSYENFLHLPNNLNFAIKIKNNKETKEPELFIQVFEDTSSEDIKKNWKVIKECQNKLREIKGIKKRYYPLKNLEIARKLAELDKKDYFDNVLVEDKKVKVNDITKAEEIYGELPLNKKKEQRAKNKIKQIRHQYKEREGG